MKKSLILAALFSCIPIFAKEITVCVGAGEHWKAKSEPQFAIWLEDEKGNFVKTLYVTKKASKKSFIFSPKEGRPESLPIWYNALKNVNGQPTIDDFIEKNFVDAVTSATPKGGVIFKAEIENKAYFINAEFNTSFDYNDFYTKKNSGVNGQPSVLYCAKIPADFGSSDGELLLSLSGTGSVDGSDGFLHPDTSNLTTAKKIVQAVIVK